MPQKKMQSVKFGSISDFLDYLPPNELKITNQLRDLIWQTIPDVNEKLSYNVPYYSRKKGLCFIWPGSVFWGQKRSYEGVRLGFHNGNAMEDPFNWLDKEGRKQVAWHDFAQINVHDLETIRFYLMEAVRMDGWT